MKRIFHFSYTLVTLSRRIRVKAIFLGLGQNLFHLLLLMKNGELANTIVAN
ncbi:MAG: hypothetical protein QW292_09165 [Candidatus Parvarchaeota archaeon]